MTPPGDAPTGASVAARAEAVRARIAAAGGDPAQIRLVAVTKGNGADAVAAAVEAGLDQVGENYAQELVAKAATPGSAGATWHFLGRLQRNKVRALAPHVALWQSVDRPALVAEIARRAPGASVLVQVALGDEPQKGGCPPAEVPALVEAAAAAGLTVAGLMGVAPTGPAEVARPGFARLRHMVDELGLDIASMGMSGDLEVAVAEGSTMVRIGTALFGPRPERSEVRK